MDELHILISNHLSLNGIPSIFVLDIGCNIVHNCSNSSHVKKIAPNFKPEVMVLQQISWR